MAFEKVMKSMDALLAEKSLSIVDRVYEHLSSNGIEMDDEMKQIFDDFKEKLAVDLKEESKTRKKSGKRAAGDKPKRKPSAYNVFIAEKMAKLKEEDDTLSAKDRMKRAIAMWNEAKNA